MNKPNQSQQTRKCTCNDILTIGHTKDCPKPVQGVDTYRINQHIPGDIAEKQEKSDMSGVDEFRPVLDEFRPNLDEGVDGMESWEEKLRDFYRVVWIYFLLKDAESGAEPWEGYHYLQLKDFISETLASEKQKYVEDLKKKVEKIKDKWFFEYADGKYYFRSDYPIKDHGFAADKICKQIDDLLKEV